MSSPIESCKQTSQQGRERHDVVAPSGICPALSYWHRPSCETSTKPPSTGRHPKSEAFPQGCAERSKVEGTAGRLGTVPHVDRSHPRLGAPYLQHLALEDPAESSGVHHPLKNTQLFAAHAPQGYTAKFQVGRVLPRPDTRGQRRKQPCWPLSSEAHGHHVGRGPPPNLLGH